MGWLVHREVVHSGCTTTGLWGIRQAAWTECKKADLMELVKVSQKVGEMDRAMELTTDSYLVD